MPDNVHENPMTRDMDPSESERDLFDRIEDKLCAASDGELIDWFAALYGPHALAEYLCDRLREKSDSELAEAMGLCDRGLGR